MNALETFKLAKETYKLCNEAYKSMNLPEQIKQKLLDEFNESSDLFIEGKPLNEIDPKDLTIEGTFTIMEPKQELSEEPSEVEKAQQAVDYWIKKISDHNDRIYHHEKEIHFAKKNLKVHERSLKALIQLENEMKG